MPSVKEQEEIVSTQKHYTQFKIQPIEFIDVNKIHWCAGNVIKYVCRADMKNGLEDLLKARTYLNVLIEHKSTGVFKTPEKLIKKPSRPPSKMSKKPLSKARRAAWRRQRRDLYTGRFA